MESLRLEKGYRAWGHELSTDETSLEIGVNLACGLWGGCAAGSRPCTDFLGPRREKSLQAQQGVTRADHTVESRTFKPEILEKAGTLIRIDFRDLLFDCGTDHNNLGLTLMGMVDQLGHLIVAIEILLRHIGDIERGFSR